MKTLHLSILVILTSSFILYNNVFADNETTDYGGLVRSHQTMTPVLPSPPLGLYPYTSKISSVFQIDPEIIHPTDTSVIHILVTNNANFPLYDVNLGESLNDSKYMMLSNIHKIDILSPNQTKTISGTLYVSADVQPTNYYDIWWNVVAKNQTGNMMESMQFHRNLPIAQNLPQKSSGPVIITLESPLRQFKSGIAAKDIQCNQGLELMIRLHDYVPACVKSTSIERLLRQGWVSAYNFNDKYASKDISNATSHDAADNYTIHNIIQDNQTSSTGKLFLSVDQTYANPAQAVVIDISLNNTSTMPLALAKSDNWPRSDLRSGLCSNLPLGIAILKGYYTEQNMTGAKSLVIYPLVPCPMPSSIKSYTIQPLSSKATQECDSLFSCPELTDMSAHLTIPDFIDNAGQHHSFDIGQYTIVGGDEWGHVAIQHFTEEYATAYSDTIGK